MYKRRWLDAHQMARASNCIQAITPIVGLTCSVLTPVPFKHQLFLPSVAHYSSGILHSWVIKRTTRLAINKKAARVPYMLNSLPVHGPRQGAPDFNANSTQYCLRNERQP
jgi:hypothetical protein